MTLIGYIADVHVGNMAKGKGETVAGVNARARDTLAALARAVEEATARGCTVLAVAGDLFHYARVEPQIVAAVQRILTLPAVVIVGNHDVASLAPGDHAIAPLGDHVTLVERASVVPVGDVDMLAVPFEPGPPMEWLPGRLESLRQLRRPGARSHLMLHMGISDLDTPYFLDQSAGHIAVVRLRELMEKHSIDWAFAGDWHRHQSWPHERGGIVQIGCLSPNRYPPGEHEHGHIGPLIISSPTGFEIVDIPGPRFVKLKYGASEIESYPLPQNAAPLYVKLTCNETQEKDARALLEEFRALGQVVDAELHVDRVLQRAAQRTASHEARTAGSVDEALRVYVETMPVAEGVSRDQVLRLARKYLA